MPATALDQDRLDPIESIGLPSNTPIVTIVDPSTDATPQGAVVINLAGADDPPAILRHYPPDHPVRICLNNGDRIESTVADLATAIPPGAERLLLPELPQHETRQDPQGLRATIDRLRDPDDGCPWDLAQTHQSLRPHLLEETYEVLDALANGTPEQLCEELGDLLMQVVLHAKLAEQDGRFTLDDIAEGIRAKLIRRHPHVFADADADTPELVEGAWERLKARERPERRSVLDGIPRPMPALARAQAVLGRAQRNGFRRPPSAESNLGEAALDLAMQAREAGLNAEDAARDALDRFETRLRGIERKLAESGRKLADVPQEELDAEWHAAS